MIASALNSFWTLLMAFLGCELGEFDAEAAAKAIEKLGTDWAIFKKKADADIAAFGEVKEETQGKLTEIAESILAQKERLDALETKQNRPRIPEEIASLNYQDLMERADATLQRMKAENKDRGENDLRENYYTLSEIDAKAVDRAYYRVWRKALATSHIGNMFGGLNEKERDFAREVKASVIADDTNAGYLLAPPEMVRGIIKLITEISPIRQLAEVRTGTTHEIKQPRRTARPSATWIGETATRSETTGLTYGILTWTPHEEYMQLHASRQMLADAGYDLEDEFAQEAAESFASNEGTAYVSGNGSGRPEGITSSSLITTKSAATSGTIAADDIIDITIGQIKEPYLAGASWLWNRANVSRVLQLKDGNGQYLWSPGLQVGAPSMLYGFPWRTATDLASTESASSNVALFGDYRAGYRIYDRTGMEFIRDIYSSKDTGLVEFDFYRRTDGRVKKGEALVLYQL